MRTFLISIALAFACAAANAKNEKIGNCTVHDYGEGVYSLLCPFPGEALVELRKRNPGAIITMTFRPNDMYFVIINKPPGAK